MILRSWCSSGYSFCSYRKYLHLFLVSFTARVPEAKRATRLKSNVVNVVMVAQQRGNSTVFVGIFIVDDETTVRNESSTI